MSSTVEQTNFTRLIEQVSDHAIYMLDVEGRVLSWNPAAQRIKGYARHEVVGQSFERFFTAEDRSAGVPGSILAQARAAGHVESEGWRVRKNGDRSGRSQPFTQCATTTASWSASPRSPVT